MTRAEWIRRARAALRRLRAARLRARVGVRQRRLAQLGEELEHALPLVQVQERPHGLRRRTEVADPALARLVIRAEAAVASEPFLRS